MDKKQIDRQFDGMKLTDPQLDHVIGGVNLSPTQAVDLARGLAVKAVKKPLFKK